MDKIKVEVSCEMRVKCSNPNVEMIEEEFSRYEQACEAGGMDEYFEELAQTYCDGAEWQYDWVIDPTEVIVEKRQ